MQERVEVTLAALDEHPRALIYLYNAELDQAGHAHGWESDPGLRDSRNSTQPSTRSTEV